MTDNIRKLNHLLAAARAVSPECSVRFCGTLDEAQWVCLVVVGNATIYESKPGSIDEIMDLATAKLKGVSKRMMAALDAEEPTPIPSKT